MKLVDANVLIYAANSDAVQHDAARRWLESAISDGAAIGVTWNVILAFLRIVTHPRILERPISVDRALAYIDFLLQQPAVELVAPGPRHWSIVRQLIATAGTGGNLTSDAHLAAIALEGGWTVVSWDNDFRRFAGIELLNPISP